MGILHPSSRFVALVFGLCLLAFASQQVTALASRSRTTRPPLVSGTSNSLLATLQQCLTPNQVLERVGRHVTALNDPDHAVNGLIWTRLCKQLVASDNQRRYSRCDENADKEETAMTSSIDAFTCTSLIPLLSDLASQMRYHPRSISSLVDATKAATVVLRILAKDTLDDNEPNIYSQSLHPVYDPLMSMWKDAADEYDLKTLESNQLSGLFWALDGLASTMATLDDNNKQHTKIPDAIQDAYQKLELPFRIYPNSLCGNDVNIAEQQLDPLHVHTLLSQIEFSVGDEATIYTPTGEAVTERRQTAWQGDDGVGPFLYSGKSMQRQPWSPLVRQTRDLLRDTLLGTHYDCCLINHYHDGSSAMRYHADPDQGTLWDYDTTVVSVGATRRFAVRDNAHGTVHSFWVMDGDVTHMFGDCQQTYQHTVKKAESKTEIASRASLVFKKSWKQEATG